LLVALAAACAGPLAQKNAWPAPPAKERIRFVRTYSGSADVESSWSRIWRKLAGVSSRVSLYHPVGVAVSQEGDLLAVTDQAIGALFLFDLQGNALETVQKEVLGGAPLGVAIAGAEVWTVVPERKVALAFDRKGRALRSVDLSDCERPTGLAIDAKQGLLFASDTSSTTGAGHAVHVHALADGTHKAAFGKKGDGQGELFFPTFLSLNDTSIYVADTMNARVVEFDRQGAFVRQFGERGDRFGNFDKPKGVALDSFGNLYVVDAFFSAVQIFNRNADLLLFFGGPGATGGFLSNPAGIAIDGHDRIYVTNGLNFRVDVYQLVNTTAADSEARTATAASP